MKKQIYLWPVLILCFSLALVFSTAAAFAQSNSNTNDSANVNSATSANDINANDLGISEPKILPDSPWYGLKKFWEGLRDSFVFNPIVKAENNLTRASERLIEMQKLIDQGKIKDADKVIRHYEKKIEQIKDRIAKLKDVQSDKAEKFLDKFAEYQIKHRLILEKIEKLSDDPEAIAGVKEKALDALSEALSKTDNEKTQKRLEDAISKIEDGDSKQLKNLEILKALEERVPESARPAILRAQANALKRLREDVSKSPISLSSDEIEKLLEEDSGNESRYLEILDELIANDNLSPELIRRLQAIRLKLQERLSNEDENNDEGDDDNNVICAQDMFTCSNGLSVSRSGRDCKFVCPEVDDNENENENRNSNSNTERDDGR
ncbi:MAG: DUF5667 domain-containing protein [Candidatus Buchananbacteria bacterium]|nr:DUF5667 domain-containing protein [Candidatus Buchananbacteria bacterium]